MFTIIYTPTFKTRKAAFRYYYGCCHNPDPEIGERLLDVHHDEDGWTIAYGLFDV